MNSKPATRGGGNVAREFKNRDKNGQTVTKKILIIKITYGSADVCEEE